MYILIVNQDPLGRSLAAALVDGGHEVAYLDENPEYCQMVARTLGCLVIQGETTSIRILQEAGIERADAIVILLEKDIKNIMVGLFARQFHVPRILARQRQEHYRAAYEMAGITDVFSDFDYMLNKFLVGVEDPNLRHVMTLGAGDIEIAGIEVPAQSGYVGQRVNRVWEGKDFPEGALLLGVLKVAQARFEAARSLPLIEAGDEVIVLSSHNDMHRIARILRD